MLYKSANKQRLMRYAWGQQVAFQGVLWLMSTREQTFESYEVLYAPNDNVGVNIPTSQCFYIGLVREIWPLLKTPVDLVNTVYCCLECWAGSRMSENAIDLYHRMLYKGIRPIERYAHYVVYDVGTDPTQWFYGRRMEGRGAYDCSPWQSRL